MRKLATTFICFFAASNFSLADPLLFKEEIPKEDIKLNYPIVEYPTDMIARFLNFCMNLMVPRMLQEGAPQEVAVPNAAFMCGCVMDSYRKNQDEAVFQYELSRKEKRDVPNFSEYLDTCNTLNKQRGAVQSSYDPMKSIWVKKEELLQTSLAESISNKIKKRKNEANFSN